MRVGGRAHNACSDKFKPTTMSSLLKHVQVYTHRFIRKQELTEINKATWSFFQLYVYIFPMINGIDHWLRILYIGIDRSNNGIIYSDDQMKTWGRSRSLDRVELDKKYVAFHSSIDRSITIELAIFYGRKRVVMLIMISCAHCCNLHIGIADQWYGSHD